MDTVTISAKVVRGLMRRQKMSPYDLARAAGLGEAALKTALGGKPVSKHVASILAAALASSIETLAMPAERADRRPRVGNAGVAELAPDIIQRYQSGATVSEIAQALDCSLSTVRRALAKVERRRKPVEPQQPPNVDAAAVAARYQERLPDGVTLTQIGEEFGLSGDQVSTLLERAGVQTRVKMLAAQRHARTPIPCGCGCGATLVPVDRAGKSTRRTFIEGHRRPTKESRFAGLTPEIARRYKAGETAQELATAFDVNFKTIYKVLKSAGVERRPPGTHSKATIIKRMETQSESLRKELSALESKLALAKEQIGASA